MCVCMLCVYVSELLLGEGRLIGFTSPFFLDYVIRPWRRKEGEIFESRFNVSAARSTTVSCFDKQKRSSTVLYDGVVYTLG